MSVARFRVASVGILALIGLVSASGASATSARATTGVNSSPTAATLPARSAAAAHGHWSKRTLIDAYGLNDVSCASTTFCLATDAGGRVLVYRSGIWSAAHPIAPGVRAGVVRCSSPTFCLIVNYDRTTYTYDGTSFTSAGLIPGFSSYASSVSCSPDSTCEALDQNGESAAYADGHWTNTGVTPVGGGIVSCASPAMCMAVGYQESSIFDGSSWGPVTHLAISPVSLSCVSMSFCVALDGYVTVAKYDGQSWRLSKVDAALSGLYYLSCPRVGWCLAMTYGDAETGVMQHRTWTDLGPLKGEQRYDSIRAVSCATATFCVAVDHRGNALTYS